MTTSNATEWAAGLAHRLRLIQSNWADEEASVRLEYLGAELKRSLQGIPEETRAEHLARLEAHFPDALAAAPAPPPPAVAAPASAAEAAESLLELLPTASGEERAAITARLREAGLVPPEPADEVGSFNTSAEMARRLRLKTGAPLSSANVQRLLLHLIESTLVVDDFVWNLWKQVAPNSTVRRRGRAELINLLAGFLTNDSDVGFSDVADPLEFSRRLNTSLLGALGPLGRNFAKRHREKFSPEAIREAVELEGVGFLKAKAVQCWQKYEDLVQDASEEAITLQLREMLANYAEDLLAGSKTGTFTSRSRQ